MKKILIIISLSLFISTVSAEKNVVHRQLEIEEKAINYYYQGDYENYFKQVVELIKLAPYTEVARFYLISSKIEKSMINNYDKIFTIYEELIQKPEKLDFFTFQIMLEDLIEYYISQHNINKARAIFNKTGCINEWLYAGPFVQTFYNDLNERFAGIEDSLLYNKAVQWKRLIYNTDWGWVPLGVLLYPSRKITAYASCNIYFPESKNVILWLTTYSSAKLFIDTQTILTNDTFANKGKMHILYKLKIPAGWHHLIVKTVSENNSPDFKLSLLSESGTPLTDIKIALKNKKINNELKIEKELIYPEIYQYYKSRIRNEPYNSINYFRKAMLDFNLFNLTEAKDTLVKGMIVDNENPLIKYYLARFYYYSYTETKKNYEIEKARSLLEEVLKLKNNFVRAREYLARCHLELDKIDSAYKYISQFSKKEENTGVLNLKSKYFNKIGWQFLEIEKLKESLLFNKNYIWTLRSLADFYKSYDIHKSINLFERAFNKDWAINQDLFELYHKTREHNKLIVKLKFLKTVSPYIPSYYEQIASYYESIDKHNDAIYTLKELLKIHPYPYVFEKIGDIYYRTGDYQLAKKFWQESLSLNQINPYLENKLYFLETKKYCKKNLESEFYPVDTTKIIKRAFEQSSDKKDIKYYLDLMIIKINNNGTFKYLIHQIIKIHTETGKEEYGEIRIPDNANIIKIGTYLSDNQFIEASDYKYHNNDYYFSLPGIEKGSVIEICYELDIKYSYLNFTPFFYYTPFLFQEQDADIENSIFIVIKDKEYPEIKFAIRNGDDIEFDREVLDNKILLIWKKEHSNSIEPEYNSPPLLDLVPNLFVSSITNWQIFSKWYCGKIKEKFTPVFELQQTVLKLYENSKFEHRFDSDLFIENIYYWIQKNLSFKENDLYYAEPVDEVFFKRKGNTEEKTLLMKFMLDSVNIDSCIVLARDINFSSLDFKVPSPDVFSSVLLFIPYNDKNYWISFKEKYIPFGYIDFSYITTNAFLIKDNGNYEFVEVKPLSTENIVKEYFQINLDKRYVDINGEIRYKGVFNKYKQFFEDSVTRDVNVLEQVNSLIEGINILGYSVSNVDNLKKDLVIKFDGKLDIDSKNEVDLIFDKFNLSEKYISKSKRKYPLKIYEPIIKEIETVVILKDSLKLNKPIRDLKLTNKFGEYTLNFGYTENKIKIKRSIKILNNLIEVKDYQSFLNFCAAIDKAEKEKFTIE